MTAEDEALTCGLGTDPVGHREVKPYKSRSRCDLPQTTMTLDTKMNVPLSPVCAKLSIKEIDIIFVGVYINNDNQCTKGSPRFSVQFNNT